MSNVIALVPARAGSKGIPGKNFRLFAGGMPLFQRAVNCAVSAGCDRVYLSTDAAEVWNMPDPRGVIHLLPRPAALAQDDTPMFDVVQHAAETLQLADDDVICLLQPTQPLRTPERVQEAIAALTSDWDSVVTIAPIPRTHAPKLALLYCDTTLSVFPADGRGWANRPTRRQAVEWPYIPDGTAYVFRRRTLTEHGNIYGEYVRGIIIPPDETCELDTEADWAALERRWKERCGQPTTP